VQVLPVRYQTTQATCGPAALYNAGCALGRRLALDECEAACKTTTRGTGIRQLLAGARALGFKVETELRESRDDAAAAILWSHLHCGRVAILCVDASEHWVAAVGRVGGRYLVADGADAELVLSYSEGELLQRWRAPEARRGYYAAVLS
jgi:ABC-type bacteriocin/lantibiotic exporter with double-glycine peptidase domain